MSLRRYLSTTSIRKVNTEISKEFTIDIPSLLKQTSNEKMYIYAIPLTTKKTFIYCKHTNEIFNDGKEPIESKVTSRFITLWNKFRNSPMKVNKSISGFIEEKLDQIPFMENSLLSIPSQKNMRRLNIDTNEYMPDAEAQGLPSEQLDHFNFYYPNKITTPMKILEDLKPGIKGEYEMHKKLLVRDILLMPLTIPFILIPLIPNVPGFYLLYRIYCHMKVMASVKHFILLMKGGHMDMIKVEGINELYLKTKDEDIRMNVSKWLESEGNAEEEVILLGDDVVGEVIEALGGSKEADSKLVLNALRQSKMLQ